MNNTKKVIAALWAWADWEYNHTIVVTQNEIDKKDFGYGVTYGDIRRAAIEMGIIPDTSEHL